MYGRQLLRVSGIGLFLLPSILHALKKKKKLVQIKIEMNQDAFERLRFLTYKRKLFLITLSFI